MERVYLPSTRVLLGLLAGASALCLLPGHASAQFPSAPRREYNPFRTGFTAAWHADLPAHVKLFDCAPVMDPHRSELILLVGSSATNDFRRTLLLDHWDGFRFANDASIDFTGWATDALVTGRFQARQAAPDPGPVHPDTGKVRKPPALPAWQIVCSGGVLRWTGGAFDHVCAAPPNLKLALRLEGTPDQLVINFGDAATPYEVGDTEVHSSAFELAPQSPGYPEWGAGEIPFEGEQEFLPNVKYVQTYWDDRDRWQICLETGGPANAPGKKDVTTGDRLVVYVPKPENRDKTFWELTRPEDYEEAWRSAPINGQVLDVRVGDVRNDGKPGILVLTADPQTGARTLTCYLPDGRQQ